MNELNTKNWKYFLYKDVFEIKKGYYNKKPDSSNNANIPFVGATEKNNGITSYHTIEDIEETSKDGKETNHSLEHKIFSHCITISNDGSVGYAFYHPYKFTCSHSVNPIYIKDKEMNVYIAMFLNSIISLEKYRWSYGRKWRPTRMPKSKIKLPADSDGNPDYQFMEDYIKSLYNKKVPQQPSKDPYHAEKISLDDRVKSWKWFKYEDIFEITGTKTTSLDKLNINGKGNHPYVTTKAVNNGVGGFFDYHTECGNVLCIDSAVIGYCSYQNKDFSASDHVEKLSLKKYKLNKYLAMFLVTLSNLEQYRYSYGRKRSQTKIKKEEIKLPIDSNGNPDWPFMENYIKSLPYSKNLA